MCVCVCVCAQTSEFCFSTKCISLPVQPATMGPQSVKARLGLDQVYRPFKFMLTISLVNTATEKSTF